MGHVSTLMSADERLTVPVTTSVAGDLAGARPRANVMAMTKHRVLVTGGSGFIAGHCILRLLDQGHLVRTTVRSLARESAVRAALTDSDDLSFVSADLMSDEGWAEAVSGCDFVLHVASPVHLGAVADENDLIAPAREGTLRVLRAARDAGVERVVLTSAFHAVGWGHPPTDHTFTEEDWSVLDGPGIDAYGKSKTLAERAAWEFMAAEGGSMELVTMLPVAVMGPVMGSEISGANHIVQRILHRETAGFPNLWIPIVDVRDVADAHLLAMTTAEAAGQRFLLSSGPAMQAKEIAALLGMPFEGGGVVDHAKKVSSEKARRVLGWRPRDPKDAVRRGGREHDQEALGLKDSPGRPGVGPWFGLGRPGCHSAGMPDADDHGRPAILTPGARMHDAFSPWCWPSWPSLRITSNTAPRFPTSAFSLRNAKVGTAYTATVGGLVQGARSSASGRPPRLQPLRPVRRLLRPDDRPAAPQPGGRLRPYRPDQRHPHGHVHRPVRLGDHPGPPDGRLQRPSHLDWTPATSRCGYGSGALAHLHGPGERGPHRLLPPGPPQPVHPPGHHLVPGLHDLHRRLRLQLPRRRTGAPGPHRLHPLPGRR